MAVQALALVMAIQLLAAVSANFYVRPFVDSGGYVGLGEGSGTIASPYHSLAKALKATTGSLTIFLVKGTGTDATHRIFGKSQISTYIAMRSDGHSSDFNSAIKDETVGNDFVRLEDGTANNFNYYREPCKDIQFAVTIQPYFCTASVTTNCYSSTEKATVSWWDLGVSCTIGTNAKLTLKSIQFTGKHILVNSCSENWCSHCHYGESLKMDNSGNVYTATNAQLKTLTSADLYSSLLLNSPDDTTAAKCSNYLTKDGLSDIALFILKGKAATLDIQDSSFENFRARTHSVIHIYRGALTMTDVDFTYNEPGSESMTVHGDSTNYQVHGIITSSIPSVAEITACTPANPTPPKCDDPSYVCFWGTNNNGLRDGDNFSRPCSDTSITWNRGTVSYLNYDHNFPSTDDKDAAFYPFMDLRLLDSLTLNEVNFLDNLIPNSDRKTLNAIVNVAFTRLITLTKCTFERNLATGGIFKAAIGKEYASSPNDLMLSVTDCIFSQNDPMYGAALYILESSAAQISIKNTSFTKTTSLYVDSVTSSALVINYSATQGTTDVYTFSSTSSNEWTNAYMRGMGSVDTYGTFTITADITVILDTLTFTYNSGIYKSITDCLVTGVPNVIVTDVVQSNSTPFSSGGADNSVYKLISDTSRMNNNIPSYAITNAESGGCVKFSGVIGSFTIKRNVSGLSTIKNNSISQGVALSISVNSPSSSFSITNTVISGNTSTKPSSDGGGAGLYVIISLTGSNPSALSTVTISGCTFEKNTSDNSALGGGLYVNAAPNNSNLSVILTSCTFTSNSSGSYGAAYVTAYALEVSSCKFTSNTSSGEGATLTFSINAKSAGSSFKVTSTEFEGNVAGGTASDILFTGTTSGTLTTDLTVSACTFKNSKVSDGGIIVISGASLQLSTTGNSLITGCTFSGATLSSGTGVLNFDNKSGVLKFESSQVSGITAQDGTYLMNSEVTDSASYVSVTGVTATNCSGLYGINISAANVSVKLSGCSFTSNEGASIINYGGTLTDSGSTFTKNTWGSGAVYTASSSSTATFTNSIFTSNTATSTGGVITIGDSGNKVTLTGVTATYNSSADKGGVVYCKESAKITVSNSVFRNNQSSKGSAFYFLVSIEVESTITSSTFQYNQGEGVIYMVESSLVLTSNKIDSNLRNNIYETTPGIYGISSELTSKTNTFSNHTAENGAFFVAQLDSVVTETSSTFDSGYAETYGGIMFLLESNATMTGSVMTNSYGGDAGALFCFSNSNANLIGVTMSNITSKTASIYLVSDSYLAASQSTFSIFNSTMIEGDKSSVSLTTSTIKNGISKVQTGGALLCSECISVTLTNNKFNTITSYSEGGCLYFVASSNYSYTIYGNEFYNCNATDGGAIYSTGVSLSVTYNNFTSNNATGDGSGGTSGQGGGLDLVCVFDYCSFNVSSNTFTSNQALSNGGAINWLDIEPTLLNNTYVNNTAKYGNDIACFASYIEIESITSDSTASRRLPETTLTDVASGQMKNSLLLLLKDKYGTTVATENTITASLMSGTGATLGGTTSVIAEDGILNFDSFQITTTPGSSSSITIESSGIITSLDSIYSLDIPVTMRYCIIGEILNSNACQVCSSGQYSITLNSTICNACPSSATCDGGADMYPLSGYWRSSEYTDKFFSCLLTSACTGNDNKASKIGVCDTGYESNLCQSCQDGYSRTSKNTCGVCPNSTINALRLSGIAIGVVLLVVIMVRSTLKSAAKPKELHSVYIKILTNYLQLVLLVSSFNLNWPSLVKSLLSTQETAGSATEQLFSFDCYLDGNFTGTDVFYQKLVIVGVLPVVIVVLAVMYWGPVALCRQNSNVLKSQLVSTIIVLLFLAHPSIVQTMFKAFSCMEIDPDETWLLEDLALKCWNTDHSFFAVAIGLPGLLVWGLGIPTLALVLLVRNRSNLRSVEVKTKYGFLYIGYKYNNFYWELIILYRKICIAFTSVFLSSISVEVQALSVMIVILVAFNLQLRYMPYENLELNMMETRSIIVAGITIYCGLYFLTNDLSDSVKIALFVLILVSNIYFIVTWVFGISHTMLIKVAKSKPYMVKKLCRCIPSLSIAADLSIREREGELYYGMYHQRSQTNADPLILEDSICTEAKAKDELPNQTDFSEELRKVRNPLEFFQMMLKSNSRTNPQTPSEDVKVKPL